MLTRNQYLALFVTAIVLSAPQTTDAAEVEIRLVAAEVEDQPLIDSLVNFRRAADRGLIATQWLSGMMLGEQPLFTVQNRGALAPEAPNVAATEKPGKSKLKDDADDLLGDIRREAGGEQEQKMRPVDVVDSLYVGQNFSLGRPVGPQRRRTSTTTINVTKPSVLQPGGQSISPDTKRIVIPCYPVTITAAFANVYGKPTTFVPQLFFFGRDLLADCLFEHSPDLPLGDTGSSAAAETLEDWLAATRGGKRAFRKLTIYLPATGANKAAAYELNGHKFQLAASGITLLPTTTNTPHTQIRMLGKFGLELLRPVPTETTALHLPLLTELGPGWQSKDESLVTVPPGGSVLALTVQSPTGQTQVLRPSLPVSREDADRFHLAAMLVGGKSTSDIPIAYVVALPRSSQMIRENLTLHASAAEANGSIALPPTASLRLEQPSPRSASPAAKPLEPIALTANKPGEYAGSLTKIPPSGYLARCTFGNTILPGVPLAVAGRSIRGAATLVTYHNRCDYYRGETVQVAVIVRAIEDVQLTNAPLKLWPEGSDKPLAAGFVSLAVRAGETRTLFVTLSTAGLPLGKLTLALEAEPLIRYPLEFTLYSPTPRTTFALYSWMTGSFSGPVRVGDKTTVNLLLDQKPSQFLRPDEVARFTAQPNLPIPFEQILASDPLLPAVEKTAIYDNETEREMAIAMRLGLRYAPAYGWGLNSQESNWNPKHSLPEDLARMRRLCSLVAQRFRDFGNYAGLHLNWYPTYGGYWENHPATDGHVARRAEYLAKQVSEVQAGGDDSELKLGAAAELDLAVAKHKFRVGALPRAYEAWTERASQLTPGLTDRPLSSDIGQPGLSPQRPLYASFLPISWFDQQSYYPGTYFSTLPAATVHAYTDYGFSPFQHLWGLDFWAAGVGDKPKWITTMSNGRDVMLPQALLAVARGADGIDINGDDSTASRVLSEFLTCYGPFFRELSPESDIAIITSLRQQILHGKLVGKWMGYTGGSYFDLYTKLWYARRPADVLLEEEVTPERLQKYRAVFLVNQQTPLSATGTLALTKFERAGGKVFKDVATSAEFPGEIYKLEPGDSIGPKWEGDKYVSTRDQIFVGVQSAYEATATELDKLLAQLPPPRATSDSHSTLVGTLAGKELAVVMAVNDTRTPPGIYHPWNFWSATVLASEGKLSFDKPYVVYDLLDGGEVLRPQPDGKGRFKLPISFDRTSARPLALLPAAIKEVQMSASESSADTRGHSLDLDVKIIDERGEVLTDPCPVEITVLAGDERVYEQFYRATRPGEPLSVTLPSQSDPRTWRIFVRELFCGQTAKLELNLKPLELSPAVAVPVLMPRRHEVQAFFAATRTHGVQDIDSEIVILLDGDEVKQQPNLLPLSEILAKKLSTLRFPIRVEVVDPLEIVVVPQRWRPTSLDQKYLEEMVAGKRVVRSESLTTKYYQGERNRNEPDWLHPASGYGEPSTSYRVGTHVILLGTASSNPFLADMHETLGMTPSAGFLSPGNAVVQVVWDAFTPGHNALCIEAIDEPGIQLGIGAILALVNRHQQSSKPEVTGVNKSGELIAVRKTAEFHQLPQYLNEFGASVHPIAFTPDGGVLASATLQAENYFRFDAKGKLQQKWLGKYGLAPAASGKTLWTSQWWGAPAYIDKVVRCDANAQPQWFMDAPRFSRSFQHWRFPGHATLPDRASDDLFVAGHCRLARLSTEGKTLWAYDDTPTASDIRSFRFRRDLMLHDVSPDGKLLLVAAFGIEPYSNFVSKFVRPALLLFDAETGKIVWEKADILIDHSPCSFAAGGENQILLGDESPQHRRLLLLDANGKELWSLPRPAGTSEAEITTDGNYAVVRPAAPRNALFQKIGEPQGLQVVQLKERSPAELAIQGTVAAWKLLPNTQQVIVSNTDGRLELFHLDRGREWSRQFTSPLHFIVSQDEQTIVFGSGDGSLNWLDWKGELIQSVDLLPYNRIEDLARYVADYTRTPGDVPHVDPAPQVRPRINARANGVVTFSKNLLANEAAAADTEPQPLASEKELRWQAEVEPGATHVLSLMQRSLTRETDVASGKLLVTILAPDDKSPLYRAELPLSALWEERTLAFRTPQKCSAVEITVRLLTSGGAELRLAGLFTLSYPSANMLAQRVPAAPGELPATRLDSPAGLGGDTKPPTIRYQIPNDVDLTALARGAPPFQRTVEFTTPFDGAITGQKTSWLAKPLAGSTHATLEVKFDASVVLGSLAVYEDSTDASHYTDTYALFAREAKTGRLMQVGSVVGNRSPFNLFTFQKLEVDAIIYLWQKSADGHARVAELEGYLAEEDLLE